MNDILSPDVGIAILRVVAGVTLAAHGYQKFFLGGRIAGTARWFDSIGMRPGKLHALAAAITEITAGALLAFGFLTSLAGAAFVAVMLVAAWTVHRDKGFYSMNSGWEYNLILAVIGVALATTGAGKYSLDHALGITGLFSGATGLLIGAVGGVLAGSGQLILFYAPARVSQSS